MYKINKILALWKSITVCVCAYVGGSLTRSFCWQVWYFISIMYNKTTILSAKWVIQFWNNLILNLICLFQRASLLLPFCSCTSSSSSPSLPPHRHLSLSTPRAHHWLIHWFTDHFMDPLNISSACSRMSLNSYVCLTCASHFVREGCAKKGKQVGWLGWWGGRVV